MNKNNLEQECTRAGINDMRYFSSLSSTNEEALEWADQNAPDFALVIADEQTHGKGRFNRPWFSPAGSCLAFSLILKPNPLEISLLPLFAPFAAVAVHASIEKLFHINAEIKWPNDILIRRKKCCGILVEANWIDTHTNAIVIGIGVNLRPASIPSAEILQYPATCIEEEAGKIIDPISLLGGILEEIKKWRSKIGTSTFFEKWQSNLAFVGEEVMIVQSRKASIIGIEKGINRQGELVLRVNNNHEETFSVGDVHLRPMMTSSVDGGTHA